MSCYYLLNHADIPLYHVSVSPFFDQLGQGGEDVRKSLSDYLFIVPSRDNTNYSVN